MNTLSSSRKFLIYDIYLTFHAYYNTGMTKAYRPKSEVIDKTLVKLGSKSNMTVPVGTYNKLSGHFRVSREFIRLRAKKLGLKLRPKEKNS